MSTLPDGVRSIIPFWDIVRFSHVETTSLAAGLSNTWIVETPPGHIYEVMTIGFWVDGIATATGNHMLTCENLNSSLTHVIPLRCFRVECRGISSIHFNSVPMPVLEADIISRSPTTDQAILAAVKGSVIGREVGINNRLTVRYNNNTNLAQVSARRFLLIARRYLDIAI